MSVITDNEILRDNAAQKIMSYYFVLKDSKTLNDFLNNTTNLNQQSLIYGRVLQLELQQNWQEAAKVAHEINLVYPNSELLRQEAFSWFCVGEIKLAWEILQNINIKEESALGWLKAFIALKNGELKLAEECIAAYLNRPLADNEEVNENFLLYLWDISVDSNKGINVSFVFPTLPASITGFDVPITRSQHGYRVLTNILNQESQDDLSNSEIHQFTSEEKIDNKTSNVIDNRITDVSSSESDVISRSKNITEIRDEIMPRLQTKIYSALNQDDVINLESSLTEIFTKINSTEAKKNLLSNAGVDPYFINNLYFNLGISEFITNLIAQFKEYKVSSRKPNYHPLISFLDYLIKEPGKYNLDDRDLAIFEKIKTFGKIQIQELSTGNLQTQINLNISKIGNSEPTIGIITALEKEYVAVQAVFEDGRDEKKPGAGAGRRYWLTDIGDSEGNPQTVAVTLADMGNNAATFRATNMLSHYPSIRSIIMCGIAGGVPHPTKGEDHVRLGDIVISNKKGIVQYDFDKESQQFTEIRAMPVAASAELVEAARYLRVNEMSGHRPWEDVIIKALQKLQWQRPPQETDLLYSSVQPDELICHPEDSERRENQPRIFLSAIGSANKLLKNPQKRDLLREQFGVKAIEMEGSGVADATWNYGKGYVVVRGICDYCDEHKSDTWQQYAAITAAAYVRTLLSSI